MRPIAVQYLFALFYWWPSGNINEWVAAAVPWPSSQLKRWQLWTSLYKGPRSLFLLYFSIFFLDLLGSGAWICQSGAWIRQLGAWICLLDAWICLLGVWMCLLGVWICLLGAWICLLAAAVPWQSRQLKQFQLWTQHCWKRQKDHFSNIFQPFFNIFGP